MYSLLIVCHCFFVAVLIALVLLQRSDSGLGLSQQTQLSSVFYQSNQGNPIKRLTLVFATLFFVTSVGLAIYLNHKNVAPNIIDQLKAEHDTQTKPVQPWEENLAQPHMTAQPPGVKNAQTLDTTPKSH